MTSAVQVECKWCEKFLSCKRHKNGRHDCEDFVWSKYMLSLLGGQDGDPVQSK